MYSESTIVVVLFVVISTFIILFLSLFIIWFVYKYQQKQQLNNEEISILKIAHQNSLLSAKIEIQEQTFQNISRDIHDNVGQKLSLAKLHLINFENGSSSDLKTIINIIGDSLEDLRDLSRNLSSDVIAADGFFKAIESEVFQLRSINKFNVKFNIIGNPIFLDSEKELILFRIIQECIQNIIKHANAKKILIELKYEIEKLTIEISDNGYGFKNAVMGQGLKNIQARAKVLAGYCTIDSKIGIGTSIKIFIPISG